jgi:hypothetical protein
MELNVAFLKLKHTIKRKKGEKESSRYLHQLLPVTTRPLPFTAAPPL